MRTSILLIALAALAAPLAAHAQSQDPVVNAAANDPQMNAAIAQAKRELPVFFGHAGSPGPGEDHFLVKFDVLPEARVEYVWAEVISHANAQTLVKLANGSNDGRFKLGQQMRVNDGDVIDWGYRKGGVMQGNYTTRVLIARLPEAEAAPVRKFLGW
jgi:uncharacterized protein YegJ (DUF2314 family)